MNRRQFLKGLGVLVASIPLARLVKEPVVAERGKTIRGINGTVEITGGPGSGWALIADDGPEIASPSGKWSITIEADSAAFEAAIVQATEALDSLAVEGRNYTTWGVPGGYA